jgi:alpha-pyrone synthase
MTKIISIASQCGEHTIKPTEIIDITRKMYGNRQAQKMSFIGRLNTIETKHAVIPDFGSDCQNPVLYKDLSKLPGTAERMQVYRLAALKMSYEVSLRAMDKAKIKRSEVTHIITVSCTGAYAPGLEYELTVKLQLEPTLKRFAVNFMGCYAAFHAFRLADLICKSEPEANILVVCVELCSLHLRHEESDDNLLSTYLFSDGAAACIMSNKKTSSGKSLYCRSFQSTLIPESHDKMGWYIGNKGFEMVLNRNISDHIRSHIGASFKRLLSDYHLDLKDIAHYAIHPGGKNILNAFEQSLNLPEEKLKISREILFKHGNMSSATILFVLEQMIDDQNTKTADGEWIYSAAFGPGITIENALFKLRYN